MPRCVTAVSELGFSASISKQDRFPTCTPTRQSDLGSFAMESFFQRKQSYFKLTVKANWSRRHDVLFVGPFDFSSKTHHPHSE